MPLLRMESAVLVMTTGSDMPQPQRIQPDHAMVARFADVVFGYCDGLTPVRALAKRARPMRPRTRLSSQRMANWQPSSLCKPIGQRAQAWRSS